MSNHRTLNRPPWIFFALTYALSWLFWIPAALSGEDVMATVYAILVVLLFLTAVAVVSIDRLRP